MRNRSEGWERDKKSEKEMGRDGTIKDSTREDITLISNKDIFYFYYYTIRFKYYSVTIIFDSSKVIIVTSEDRLEDNEREKQLYSLLSIILNFIL